ncbi:ankyrin repeat domain-containing protein [Campylobacter ureolyticus]|uniref:ankyrin repeat domain-containing protein n=1 Tax=Campylobacter ureolyticus TaxID=827 RepID=UPI0022B3F22B|nr:ankyrin repeat domain-containing protein [Campylobacter ureolyticus]MCZ6112098.1 ankyrin repeat domain-containing protein [Campylobacter ureolyticus]MDK8323381.1 ankyrin repeat domain-containing protein [Campylobacter ureolyticus]
MKNKFLNSFIIITLVLVAFIVYNKFKLSGNSHFTVTPDTIIKPGSEISKYVTQDEVDEFAFTYWDIYDENGVRYQEPNATLKILRDYLEAKDTNSVLKFLKDNNLSVDAKLQYNTTPLMYSSFHNDENTTKALINLGADVSYKDKYGLNPLAYAVENNSTKVAKILVDSGAKFEDIEEVQLYLQNLDIISQIIIDGNKMKLIYQSNGAVKDKDSDAKPGYTLIHYLLMNNFIELTELALKSGFRPECIAESDVYGKDCYKLLITIADFEPMLDLLLEHNVSGQPSKELMKEKCLNDCSSRYRDYIEDKFNLVRNEILKDYNDETKLIKLDFYYKDYNETIKLINDNKLETIIPSDEILEEFDYLTNEIKWYAKYCEEDYMQELKDFIGAGDLFYWTWEEGNKYSGNSNVIKGYENSKATFKDTREFVTFYNERNKRLEIIGLLYSYENCDDKNSPNYKGKEECKYYEKRVYIKNRVKLI